MDTLVVALIIILFLFFILREVLCWYWKINEHIAAQKETNALLMVIADKIGAIPTSSESEPDSFTITEADGHRTEQDGKP